jgi:hypothetical protein
MAGQIGPRLRDDRLGRLLGNNAGCSH